MRYNFGCLGIFIVGAKRTAFGTFGGTFKNTSSTILQTAACKAALQAANCSPELVDSVNIGNVIPVSNKQFKRNGVAKNKSNRLLCMFLCRDHLLMVVICHVTFHYILEFQSIDPRLV